MSDSTLNRFVARGTNASRLTFTPTPPTPASGPSSGYFFYETDTGSTYSWTGAAWALVGGSTSTGANPTATASDVAVNGSAVTFLRSDGAPAIQKGSSSAFGLVKVDNTTITASAGVISAPAQPVALTNTQIFVGNGSNIATGVAMSGDSTITNTGAVSVVRILQIDASDPNGSALTTGDGKAYIRINSRLNGYNLVAVAAQVTTVSSSGIPTVQIANVTDSVDMLSTKLTIDANEFDSSTAATPAVIDGAHDDVATGDQLRIDVDVAGTGTKGLIIELTFALP